MKYCVVNFFFSSHPASSYRNEKVNEKKSTYSHPHLHSGVDVRVRVCVRARHVMDGDGTPSKRGKWKEKKTFFVVVYWLHQEQKLRRIEMHP